MAELTRMGLSELYDLGESGRSTIEVMRRGISKRTAVEDAIRALSATTGASLDATEASLLYVGDEFSPGGNDHVVFTSFPRCLCFSVSPSATRGKGTTSVIELSEQIGESGPSAAQSFLWFLFQTLSDEPLPSV